MIESLQSFYINKEEPARSCLLALREIILNYDPLITETQKYYMPCFCYNKKIICYLWTDKKTGEPYILVADGKLFDMPELEQGKRSRMKIFRVDPEKDLPLEMIRLILNKVLKNISKV